MKLFVNNNLLLKDVTIASGFWAKLKGIIGRKSPVLLKNTSSIHTFFLKSSLTLYFLDKNNVVIKKIQNVSPGKIIFPVKNAISVLEIYTNTEKSDNINVGDKILLAE